jgi:hypothetical protein
MTQTLLNLINEQGKYWKSLDDRYIFGDERFYLNEPCRVVTPQVTQEKNRFWGIQSRILLEPDFNGDSTTWPLAC